MKCANCSSPALYRYPITDKVEQVYCNKHLPSFLFPRLKAGNIALTDEHSESLSAALSTLRSFPVEPPAPAPSEKKRTRKPKTNASNS